MRYGRAQRPRDFVRGLGHVPREHPLARRLDAYRIAQPRALGRAVATPRRGVLNLAGFRGLRGTPARVAAVYRVQWETEALLEEAFVTLLRSIESELGGTDIRHEMSAEAVKVEVTIGDLADETCYRLGLLGERASVKGAVFELAECASVLLEPEPTEPEPTATTEPVDGTFLMEPAPAPEPEPIPTVSDPEPSPTPEPAPAPTERQAVIEEPPPVYTTQAEPSAPQETAPPPEVDAPPRCRWLCALLGAAIGFAGGAVIANGRR